MSPAPCVPQCACGVGSLSKTPLESQGAPARSLGSAGLMPIAPRVPAPSVFSAGDFPAQGRDAISPVPWCPSSGWDWDVQPSVGMGMSLTAPPLCALRGTRLAPLRAQRPTRR